MLPNMVYPKAKAYATKDFQYKWDAYTRYINGEAYANRRLDTERMRPILDELGMRPRSFTQRELKVKWLNRTHKSP